MTQKYEYKERGRSDFHPDIYCWYYEDITFEEFVNYLSQATIKTLRDISVISVPTVSPDVSKKELLQAIATYYYKLYEEAKAEVEVEAEPEKIIPSDIAELIKAGDEMTITEVYSLAYLTLRTDKDALKYDPELNSIYSKAARILDELSDLLFECMPGREIIIKLYGKFNSLEEDKNTPEQPDNSLAGILKREKEYLKDHNMTALENYFMWLFSDLLYVNNNAQEFTAIGQEYHRIYEEFWSNRNKEYREQLRQELINLILKARTIKFYEANPEQVERYIDRFEAQDILAGNEFVVDVVFERLYVQYLAGAKYFNDVENELCEFCQIVPESCYKVVYERKLELDELAPQIKEICRMSEALLVQINEISSEFVIKAETSILCHACEKIPSIVLTHMSEIIRPVVDALLKLGYDWYLVRSLEKKVA